MTLEQLFGAPPSRPPRQLEGPQVGEVLRAGAAGLFVTLEAFGPDVELGPVRYGRPARHVHPTPDGPSGQQPDAYPPAGTPVLVAAVPEPDGSLGFWLLQADGWPA